MSLSIRYDFLKWYLIYSQAGCCNIVCNYVSNVHIRSKVMMLVVKAETFFQMGSYVVACFVCDICINC